MLPYSFAQTAKFWVALIGTLATTAIAYTDPSWEVAGLNVGQALGWVAAVATAIGTFLVKNAPTEERVASGTVTDVGEH